MDEESSIYGTVVKRTVMEEQNGCSEEDRCPHDSTTIHFTKKTPTWSPSLILVVAAVTLGGSLPLGYISGAGINPYHVEDAWVTLDTALLRILLLVGGLLGSLASLGLADWVGRWRAMIISSVVGVVGAIVHIIASIEHSNELLLAAWTALGISIGVCVTVLPLYLVEVAPPRLRSSLGAMFTVGTTAGALLSQILSLHCALGSGSAHPLLLPIFVVPVFVSWILLPNVPESPIYLYFIKRDEHYANEELAKLRGIDVTSAESEMKTLAPPGPTPDRPLSLLLEQPSSLVLLVVAQLARALTTADQIYHLSPEGSKLAEADFVAASYTASVTNCIAALVVVHLITALTWRVLLLFSSIVCALLFLTMAVFSVLRDCNDEPQHLMLVPLLVQAVVFDLGLRPIPYFLACELFDWRASAAAMAVQGATHFLSQLVSDHLFLYLTVAQFRIVAAFTLGFLTLLLVFIPKKNVTDNLSSSNAVPPKPERRVSFLPNPHRLPGAADRYRRKSEERKGSLKF